MKKADLREAITHVLTGKPPQSAFDIAHDISSDYDTVTKELIAMKKEKLVFGLTGNGECNWRLR